MAGEHRTPSGPLSVASLKSEEPPAPRDCHCRSGPAASDGDIPCCSDSRKEYPSARGERGEGRECRSVGERTSICAAAAAATASA